MSRWTLESFKRLDSGEAQGFTLIEIAIVLAVVGLLLGMGLMSGAQMLENAKRKTTGERMDKIEDAITLFAIQNNFLPCPADGSLNSANANFGRSQPATGLAACTAIANGAHVVPWITLGLDELYSRDGWGNRITYYVAGRSQGGTANGIVLHTNPNTNDGIQRVDTSYPYGEVLVYALAGVPGLTTNQLTNSSNNTAAGCSATNVCAAYALVSHGAHASGAYTGSNNPTRIATTDASAGEAENNDGDAFFVQNDPTERASSSGIFDDMVRWRSAQSIVSSCGQSACGNP
ncbi:MAG: prepilin-type N-terminal cleavage/methylation domain-containing protein [Alphaproteobacteria bacterium]|nr:prepilin-type N-terminal cleavage/methylation domain-containing protein [Alphaproteobacteria bacterium]